MYRTAMLKARGGFDRRLPACEDYELYLRLARRFPIVSYGAVVSEYRQHGANMSGNPTLMLRSAVAVLRAERRHLRGRSDLQVACKRGSGSIRNTTETSSRIRFSSWNGITDGQRYFRVSSRSAGIVRTGFGIT